MSKLTVNGNIELDPAAIKMLLMTRSIPFLSILDLEVANSVEEIPVEQIILIEFKNGNALKKGALIGLAVDVTYSVIMAVALVGTANAAADALSSWGGIGLSY